MDIEIPPYTEEKDMIDEREEKISPAIMKHIVSTRGEISEIDEKLKENPDNK